MNKKLNKLFFIREYKKGTFAVHKMQYSIVMLKFWIFRLNFLRNRGFTVVLKSSKAEALDLVRQEKLGYLEALKYIS